MKWRDLPRELAKGDKTNEPIPDFSITQGCLFLVLLWLALIIPGLIIAIVYNMLPTMSG